MFESRSSELAKTLLNQIGKYECFQIADNRLMTISDEAKEEWATLARNQHQSWAPRGGTHQDGLSGWNAGVYAAWVRHGGAYKTQNQPYISWNEAWSVGMKNLRPVWKNFNENRLQIGDRKSVV